MIDSFFLISNTGEVLIEKHWRGVTSRSVCEHFWNEVNKYETKEQMPPIVAAGKYYLISIFREDTFMLATTSAETQPLLIIEFLHRVFEIFEEYFGGVDEATIKDNFSLVYQLLEEMMDYGYPLTMEPNALKVRTREHIHTYIPYTPPQYTPALLTLPSRKPLTTFIPSFPCPLHLNALSRP
jgi:AP-3 complex subunit mu